MPLSCHRKPCRNSIWVGGRRMRYCQGFQGTGRFVSLQQNIHLNMSKATTFTVATSDGSLHDLYRFRRSSLPPNPTRTGTMPKATAFTFAIMSGRGLTILPTSPGTNGGGMGSGVRCSSAMFSRPTLLTHQTGELLTTISCFRDEESRITNNGSTTHKSMTNEQLILQSQILT